MFPLGGKRGETVKFESAHRLEAGATQNHRLEAGATQNHRLEAGATQERDQVPGWHRLPAGELPIPADAPALWSTRLGSQAITLDTDDLPEFVEAPTNPVAPPAVFNGRIEPGAAGAWKVELKRAKKYDLELRAKKLGSPLCGTLVGVGCRREGGGEATSPTIPAAIRSCRSSPPADGVYTIRVAERFRNRGGAGFRLPPAGPREAVPATSDFRLKLATDFRERPPRAGSVKWKLTAERVGGFNGAIERRR